MPGSTTTVPTRNELLLDLAAFGGTVIAAIVQGWEAADIVWASWITSLLTGLAFFLILSIKMLWDYTVDTTPSKRDEGAETADESVAAVAGGEETKGDGSDKKPTPMDANPGCLCIAIGGVLALLAWLAGPGFARLVFLAILGLVVVAFVIAILAPRDWLGVSLTNRTARAFFYLPTALFLFFFFLAHFGGFHAGHALFLSFFVPLEVDITVAEESFSGMRAAGGAFLGILILSYWPYIVSVAVKNFWEYRTALIGASKQGDDMILPYKNVIRIHLLIFALIPLASVGSSIVLTIGVLAFFFFPVESVVGWLKNR